MRIFMKNKLLTLGLVSFGLSFLSACSDSNLSSKLKLPEGVVFVGPPLESIKDSNIYFVTKSKVKDPVFITANIMSKSEDCQKFLVESKQSSGVFCASGKELVASQYGKTL